MAAAPPVELGAVRADYRLPLPPCPSCGIEDGGCRIGYLGDEPDWRELTVNVCNHCGFGYVPRVHFDLDRYYANDYGQSHGRRALPDPATLFATIDNRAGRKVKRARWHARVLETLGGHGRTIVEVGAGPGFLLHQFDGSQRFAVEGDRYSRPYLDHLGVTVLESLDDAPTDADLVAMSHVLEHIEIGDLDATVARCVAILAPGGKLLIEVPEWGYLHHRRRRTASHTPHVLFFSPDSLLATLAVDDLRLVYFQTPERIAEIDDSGVARYDGGRRNRTHCSLLMGVWEKTA